MATPESQIRYTPDEYLTLEREAEERHEYLDGQIYSMAGESPTHSTICFNLAATIGPQLVNKPCRGFSPNMKVRTRPTGLYSYPDLAIVCGEPRFHDNRRDVLLNPTVIIEVLSPSTEGYDRGEKFFRYQQIESLTDYLLVSQDKPRIEHYVRQEDGSWLYSVVSDLSHNLFVSSINCQLHLAEVYDRVEFPALPSEEAQ